MTTRLNKIEMEAYHHYKYHEKVSFGYASLNLVLEQVVWVEFTLLRMS